MRCDLGGVDMGFATAARRGGESRSASASGGRAAARAGAVRGVGTTTSGVGGSAVAAGTTVVGDDGNMYDLFAVINHMGSMLGGHYTANCKFDSLSLSGSGTAAGSACAPGSAVGGGASDSDDDASAARWLHFDDHKVTEISDDAVVTKDAYLLFFRRRQLSPHNIIGCLS